MYDVQWHCRRCGLQSDTYVMAQETPPAVCPRCAFESMPYDSTRHDQAQQAQSGPDLSEKEKEFLARSAAKIPDFLAMIAARYTKKND